MEFAWCCCVTGEKAQRLVCVCVCVCVLKIVADLCVLLCVCLCVVARVDIRVSWLILKRKTENLIEF